MCGAIQLRWSFDRRRITGHPVRRTKTNRCSLDPLQQYFILNELFERGGYSLM
jgi:hypothetical protein